MSYNIQYIKNRKERDLPKKRIKVYIAYFHQLTMGIQHSLLSSPRERSGSRTSNRYAYQKDWTICKLLDLHEKEQDYCLIVELHEDVVILDSEVNPKEASFYQVKTKDKPPWSIQSLTKKGGKSANSALGKLYQNRIKFGEYAKNLYFVSNAYYNIKLEDKSKKSKDRRIICLEEIDTKSKEALIKKINEEIKLVKESMDAKIVFLERSELDIHSHEDATKGRIGNFLERNFNDIRYKIGVIYRTLFDEVKIKSNEEFACHNFEELKKYKTISKREFESMLKTITTSFSEGVWGLVSKMLVSEDFPIHEIKQIKSSWEKYEMEIINPNALAIQKVKTEIINLLNTSEEKFARCKDLLNSFIPKLMANEEIKTLFDEHYIKAMILKEYFSNEQR